MSKFVDYMFENCECVCDNCGSEKTVDSTDYSEINKELRDEGWIIRRIDDSWYEFCCYECCDRYISNHK